MSQPSELTRSKSFSTLRRSLLRRSQLPVTGAASSADPWRSLPVILDGHKAVLRFSSDQFEVSRTTVDRILKEPPTLQTALQNVLYAQIQGESIILSTLARKKKHLVLVKVEGTVDPDPEAPVDASVWTKSLLQAAYPGISPRRKFLVLVNPAGGQGKARSIYENRLKSIFDAARCETEVIYTTHHGHAKEIATKLSLVYDAVLTVSGDGLPNEVVNGFAERLDARTAFERIPVAPIPAGSGNGFAVNLLGVEDGMDPVAAALNAIKGRPMALDLASVTLLKSRETTYAFMTQAGGLMAELDLGTENLRWMGDTRFIVGFLRGVVNNTARKLKVTIRNPETDKEAMLHTLLNEPAPSTAGASETTDGPLRMPRPNHLDESDESEPWIEFKKPVLYTYGGLMPWVGRDLMDFPMKQPCDGKIHLVIQELETRPTMIKMIDGGPKGLPFFLRTHRYFKTQAYRVVPTEPPTKDRAHFAVDGEPFPYEGFHVEAHPGIMKTLSMHNRFIIPPTFGKEGLKVPTD